MYNIKKLRKSIEYPVQTCLEYW